MSEKVMYENYRLLACASIVQAVNDFLEDDESNDFLFYTWCNNCSYFDYLNIDREYFYCKVLRLKEKGIKKVKY